MARHCEICGKVGAVGSNISHAHNVTKRRWEPNLQRVRARLESGTRRIWVCARCLRSGKVEKAGAQGTGSQPAESHGSEPAR
ncbi:MAG: 50S ribosomal protein L28 [candidate division WOR-3 bacterium]